MAHRPASLSSSEKPHIDPFECNVCGEKLKSADELVRHMKEAHAEKVRLRKMPHPKKPGG